VLKNSFFSLLILLFLGVTNLAFADRPGCVNADEEACSLDDEGRPSLFEKYTAKYARSILPGAAVGYVSGFVLRKCVLGNQYYAITALLIVGMIISDYSIIKCILADLKERALSHQRELLVVSGIAAAVLAFFIHTPVAST
jgi:hypothetical protein